MVLYMELDTPTLDRGPLVKPLNQLGALIKKGC